MFWWIIGSIVAYVLIGFCTLQFNAYLLRYEPMPSTGAVIRNAVLWPIFLPILIYAAVRG